MSHALYRLGSWSARHPWRVIVLWVITAAVFIGASAAGGRALRDSFSLPGVDSSRATELLSRASSAQAGVTARVVATPTDGRRFVDSADGAADLARLTEQLGAIDGVVAVSAPQHSPDDRVAMLTVQYPLLESLSAADLDRLTGVVERFDGTTLHVEAGGELFFHLADAGGGSSELLGLVAAVIILLVTFGSVIAMGLPIVTALVGLAIGLPAMGLVTYLIEIPSDAPGMAAMVGIGVGIDYALFLVTRYREFRAEGDAMHGAVGRALATAGQAVLFAGGTVVVAILGLAVAGVPMMTAAGVATSAIVAIMVAASLTLVPALLGLSGPWIDRLTVHRRVGARRTSGHRAAQWAGHVGRHPWPYALGATVALLALAAPMLRLQLGFPDDGTLPRSRTERRSYDMASDGFGPGVNGPLVIAVDLARSSVVDRREIVDRLADAVAADPGVAAVATPSFDVADAVATVVATPSTKPQAAATYDTVLRLRGDVIPQALAGSGVTAHIGGATASFGDIAGRVTDRLALFVAAVLLASFVLLLVLFRSVLVPLKAVALNLLSIGAAYGVMVMVFQWGWGKDLIGLESTLPIVSLIPMFMFAVLFGLSMDYEVFLLSRIREEYLSTGDNRSAIVHGLAGSARVITSAALIMIAVFGGFVFDDDPMLKMLGLGLATAIAIDATVVRLILVPATMTLLGSRNWWLPDWLDRRLPKLGVDGHSGRQRMTTAS